MFTAAANVIDSKKFGRQLFEYAFGLKAGSLDGDSADKPRSLVRRDCFAALRDLYIANGRPFRKLGITSGGVDWSRRGQGVYELFVETSNSVDGSGQGSPSIKCYVRNTIARRNAQVPQDAVGEVDADSFVNLQIKHNFSAGGALLVPPAQNRKGDIYIADLFPRQVRTLQRRISDTLAASGGEADARQTHVVVGSSSFHANRDSEAALPRLELSEPTHRHGIVGQSPDQHAEPLATEPALDGTPELSPFDEPDDEAAVAKASALGEAAHASKLCMTPAPSRGAA